MKILIVYYQFVEDLGCLCFNSCSTYMEGAVKIDHI